MHKFLMQHSMRGRGSWHHGPPSKYASDGKLGFDQLNGLCRFECYVIDMKNVVMDFACDDGCASHL